MLRRGGVGHIQSTQMFEVPVLYIRGVVGPPKSTRVGVEDWHLVMSLHVALLRIFKWLISVVQRKGNCGRHFLLSINSFIIFI